MCLRWSSSEPKYHSDILEERMDKKTDVRVGVWSSQESYRGTPGVVNVGKGRYGID